MGAVRPGADADVLSRGPAPFRQVDWLERDIAVEHRPDGTIRMKSRIPLTPFERHVPAFLTRWAQERPDQVWLGQRAGSGWQELTYANGKRLADAVTQALLDLPPDARGPIAILSGNSIEHAIVMMAGMQARLPVAPISPAYSLQSGDHSRLKHIFRLIRPKIIFVQDTRPFVSAFLALDLSDVTVISVAGSTRHRHLAYDELTKTKPTCDVKDSIDRIDPAAPAKYLFTSGSTGVPKAVITTQRMMCANVAMINQCRSLSAEPGVSKYLDLLPWNHVMGGNGVFNVVLSLGLSLYIDDGKPVGEQFSKTIRNLRDISPISYTNTPAGFASLAAALEADDELCRSFFKNLKVMTYGGARLPNDVYARVQALAVKTTGQRIVFTTTYGATETAPAATMSYWNAERVGLIGLPCPGVELKLLPVADGKYEVRIKSVAVTPGYQDQPDLTEAAFDEEGFYKIGDLVEFAKYGRPAKGLVFAGRLVEDFKLLSGTFVLVSALRVDAIAAASPLISDALVAGQDRDEVGLLAWPHLEACRSYLGDRTATIEKIVGSREIRDAIRWGIHSHNVACGNAGSRRIGRVLLLSDPPSIDHNEITDKGYINQRAGLIRRSAAVEHLYADPVASDVIIMPR